MNPVDAGVGDQNEPAEIREHTKGKLYKLLTETYTLPSKDSRAINRAYLVRVYLNTVFRIERVQLLEYEAHLHLDEQARNSYQNLLVLFQKADVLLVQRNLTVLGFRDGSLPDEEWAFRVLRFIDPSNILSAFKRGVRGAIPQMFHVQECILF